jgi:quercetin dioxygenase-like cupin family protein
MKRLAVLGAMVILALSATMVSATPPSGATGVVLGRGTNQVSDTLTAGAGLDVVTQMITFAPGATTGWHTHPGEVAVVVVSGTISLWRTPGTAEQPDCTKRDVTAGQGWVAPGSGTEYDLARNETTSPVVVLVTYVNVPVGSTALLTHQTTNPCPGTPDEFASSGTSGAILGRATIASAISIPVPSGLDFVMQEVVIAPGGTSGWHTHPGQSLILVTGSDVTFVHDDCTTTSFPAGSGFIDQPGVVHMVRNDSDAPAILFATYTNVPVGGAFRIDASAPACAAAATPAPPATPASPAPTATPAGTGLPNTATGDDVARGTSSGIASMWAIVAVSGAGLALTVVARRRRETE